MIVYLPGIWWLIVVASVSLVLGVLSSVFSSNEGNAVDHLECFDCGIDPIESCRVPFAVHFFVVAVVFVVFDAEMLLSLPIIVCPIGQIYWVVWLTFLEILFMGLVLEFFIQTIDWNE